ncbi:MULTISPECIES: PDR/VanB family oxidoreductase [Streptomyces]|uniref:PDR/VanB family oxidoreductase n=1 Tax=Streptomyces TaxID=1883 RepID=UPI000F7B016F|nr:MULTISPECIES: PDR/VanB family oxidoreductase [Streptomyces]RSS99330.1 oxidoreductase [Streptomyces sp. WAC07149]GLX23442.1 iron-sulfur protein [Streptomyces lavendulae subsp. lavendulae]GLX31262.1 iron-sulfur protein [Streptomyces lavendulae subsp. lavendulae]
MRRALAVTAVAGAAVLTRRALLKRIGRSPLWPLPALEDPVSGYSPRRTLHARITSRTEPAEGVLRLVLESDELPSWTPGAHVDLTLPSGLVRQYSLCGDPAEAGRWTIAVRLVADGRGGSREAHERLVEGTEVRVRPPRNRFELEPAASYAFVAGGIGITPVLPMLRAATAAGADWTLLYGGRSRASMPFLPELAAYGDRVTVAAEDETGLPDLAPLSGIRPGTLVYCCGPEPLMRAVTEAVPDPGAVRLERFAAAAPAEARPFTVELARTGAAVEVAADESALAAVRRVLPATPYSCEQGFCGTCRHRVLAGRVDHRDELLTDGERAGSMLLCVSRAESDRLVLDL